MRSLSFAVVAIATVLLSASPAFAVWGVSEWGTMVWGEAASAVPALQAAGVVLLIAALLAVAAWRLHRRSVVASLLLVGLVLPLAGGALEIVLPDTFLGGTAANAEEVNANFEISGGTANSALVGGASSTIVTMPHTFSNGQVAEATEVNANFQALETAAETAWGEITAATRSACTTAGGTWENDACTAAPDVTANDEAVCTAAGGTWAAGTCTASVADYESLGSYPACFTTAHCVSLGGYVAGTTCYLVATHPGPWGYVEVSIDMGGTCS